jgi:hypothetical protein
VPRVHNGVRLGLRTVDESLFPVIAPRLLGEVIGELRDQLPSIPTFQRPKVWWELHGIFLNDRDSYRFRLPGHCGIFTA